MPRGVPGDPGFNPARGPRDASGAGDCHGELVSLELLPDKKFGILWFLRQPHVPEPQLCQGSTVPGTP